MAVDVLLEQLARTAQRVPPERHRDLVREFQSNREPSWQQITIDNLPYPQQAITQALEACLQDDRFALAANPNRIRNQVIAQLEGEYDALQGWLRTIPHLPSNTLRLKFEVRAAVTSERTVILQYGRPLVSWVETLEPRLRAKLASVPPERLGEASLRHNPTLGPGEELTEPFSGRLLDFSGCARREEIADLIDGQPGALPLGVYTFDGWAEAPDDELVLLGRYRNGGRIENNGTLVIAPQNSGKTELIIRWALAANRAGYNLFVVDVKGTMHRRLMREGLQGKVCHFSTDPKVTDGARLNLLYELHNRTPDGRKEIEQLVSVLLPLDQFAQGDNFIHGQLSAKWLNALINLSKLYEAYFDETVELAHVYDLANDQELLLNLLARLQEFEDRIRADDPGFELIEPGVECWRAELALLIPPGLEAVPGGQLDANHTFQSYTVSILTALRPFARHGTLFQKVSGVSDFSLRDLNRGEQLTVVLAAREQDVGDAEVVLAAVIKRLEQIMYERREIPPERRSRVLLLLDEARRIRGFQAGQYITFARDAEAGCVLVYQSISQIKTEAEKVEILENVGTQIYLKSLVGETAQRFIDLLPKRMRPTFTHTSTTGESWSQTRQTGQELVPYFSTMELYRLRSGSWPALVYIKDHGAGKPFLVDMDGERIKAATGRARPAGLVRRPARNASERPA